MDNATARPVVWTVIGALVTVLIGAAGAVGLWSHYYWDHPIGIGARLILVAVIATLFAAVYMQTRPQ
jgi:hypothetical protein